MMTEPIRLFDSDESPNGRRYTHDEREAAYVCWKMSAGRSQRKTAEKLNIAASTISGWSQSDGWLARAEREDLEAAESMRSRLSARVMAEVDDSISTIVAIRDNEATPARDRLNAATWLLGVAGVSPVTKTQQLGSHANQPGEIAPELNGLSVNELMAVEATYRTKRQA